MKKRLLIILSVILASFALYGQTPYKIQNKYLNQYWLGDTAKTYIYADSTVLNGTNPLHISYTSIYFKKLTQLGDTSFLAINSSGKLITAPYSSGGGSSLWTYNGTNLHPIDTGKNVAVGTNNALGNIFHADRGNVLFGKYNPSTFIDSLFYWDASKGAIRAGLSRGQWVSDSIGRFSAAFNSGSAKYWFDFAVNGGVALGGYSFSANYSRASGDGAASFGADCSEASGQYSFSQGYCSKAMDFAASALNYSSAFASASFSANKGNSHGIESASFNESNTYGTLGFSQGKTTSKGYCTSTFGMNNDTTGLGDWASTPDTTKIIFEVGVGYTPATPKNAFKIRKDGLISFLHYSFPKYDGSANQVLTTNGSGVISWQTASGGIPVDSVPFRMTMGGVIVNKTQATLQHFGSFSSYGTGGATPNTTYNGPLCYFNAAKGAFRAGYNTYGYYFADAQVGTYSAGFNNLSLAQGSSSFAANSGTTAAGATGYLSAAFNTGTSNNINSFSTGNSTIAGGVNSFAGGEVTNAASYCGVAFGTYNIGTGTAGSWNTSDYLLELGNGTGSGAKNNAFSVLKNGTTYIGDRDAATNPVVTVNTSDSTLKLLGKLVQYRPDHAYITYSDGGYTVPIVTQGTWKDATDSTTNHMTLQEGVGFVLKNDTLQYKGYASAHLKFNVSITVRASNALDWEFRVFNITDNATVGITQLVTTTGTNNYQQVGLVAYDKNADVNDKYIIQIRNLTSNADPVIYRCIAYMDVVHYK